MVKLTTIEMYLYMKIQQCICIIKTPGKPLVSKYHHW